MSEPTLIQQQRNILRNFHQAITQRAQAEADAEAHLKSEQEAAEAELNRARQQDNAQRDKAREIFKTAQDVLRRWKRQNLLEKISASPSTGRHDGNPAQEMERCVGVANQFLKKVVGFQTFGKAEVFSEDLGGCLLLILAVLLLPLSFAIFLISYLAYLIHKSVLFSKRQWATLVQSVADAEFWHQRWLEQAQETYQREQSEAQAHYRQTRDGILRTFHPKIKRMRSIFADFTTHANALMPPWNEQVWDKWTVAADVPTTTRLGEL